MPSSKRCPQSTVLAGGTAPGRRGNASPSIGIAGRVGPPPLCPAGSWDGPLSLPDLTIFSNGTASVQFPVPSSPRRCHLSGTCLFPGCRPRPGPAGHAHPLPLPAPGCPELTAKHNRRLALASPSPASLLAESPPGNASYGNVQGEERVTSSAARWAGGGRASVTGNRCPNPYHGNKQ